MPTSIQKNYFKITRYILFSSLHISNKSNFAIQNGLVLVKLCLFKDIYKYYLSNLLRSRCWTRVLCEEQNFFCGWFSTLYTLPSTSKAAETTKIPLLSFPVGPYIRLELCNLFLSVKIQRTNEIVYHVYKSTLKSKN